MKTLEDKVLPHVSQVLIHLVNYYYRDGIVLKCWYSLSYSSHSNYTSWTPYRQTSWCSQKLGSFPKIVKKTQTQSLASLRCLHIEEGVWHSPHRNKAESGFCNEDEQWCFLHPLSMSVNNDGRHVKAGSDFPISMRVYVLRRGRQSWSREMLMEQMTGNTKKG